MIFELIGWLGAILFILSYFLLSRGIWRQEQMRYHVFNLLGAVCLVINAIHFRDTANILANSIWAAVALLAIYNGWGSLFRKRS